MELERIGNGEDDGGGVIFTESKYEYLRPYVARVAERARDLGGGMPRRAQCSERQKTRVSAVTGCRFSKRSGSKSGPRSA